jgi:hypothetical protein
MAKVKQTISLDKDLYEAANRAAGLQMLQTGESWTVSKVVNEALDLYLQHLGIEVVNTEEFMEEIRKRQESVESPYKTQTKKGGTKVDRSASTGNPIGRPRKGAVEVQTEIGDDALVDVPRLGEK